MKNFLSTAAIVLLTLVVAATMIGSVAVVLGYLVEDTGPTRFLLLPAIAISSGVLIAILTFVRDNRRQRDEIYLNLAERSFEDVHQLLVDRNNDRVIWVRAARLLLKALELKSKIETPDIIQAYELAEEKLRVSLYLALSKKNSAGIREALPPQFFYGIDDWETEKSLDSAAIKSGGPIVVHHVTIDENIPESKLGALSTNSVIAIFEFMEFPENYDDPLAKVDSWDERWEDSNGMVQGAKRFVSHSRRFAVVDGKLVDVRTQAND